MPTAAPSRRPLLIVLAVVLLVAVAGGAFLATRDDPSGTAAGVGAAATSVAEEPEQPGPVLIVPGYGGVTRGLELLADRFRATGRDVTVMPLPGDGTGDLREAAAALDDAVTAALGRTGARSVDVIGYSAGGLVARIWVADGNADVTRRVLTLGSPHHGTRLAGLAGAFAADRCPEACRQMIPDSELLAELGEDETPDGVDWVSVWTVQDAVVTPAESARLDGAVNVPVQEVCAAAELTHQELPTDPLVQEIVLAELGADDPVALGPEDCARLGG